MKVLSAALVLVCSLFVWSIPDTAAQGVTTASITGVVRDAQGGAIPGATVVAVHQSSGTSYEGVSQADGRFFIPGMRVGGPYKVTASLSGFTPESKDNITLSLGVAQDVDLTLQVAAVAETVEVVGTADPVFASSRTGAATAISRAEIADLPTISGRINDLTRLTPQARGNSFSGQDDRQNNITVDGSYFNSAFGLGEGQPGGRTGVAPISLESIEQVQVSVAPYDVRQGNFIGAAVNTVTRSGTNELTASVYRRYRNQDYVGTEARGLAVNPGTFTFKNTGVYGGGPIVKNRLFVFGNYENEKDTRPLHTFVANTGGQPVGGSVTRVLASDLDALSSYLKQNFKYDTGGYQNVPAETPAKRYLLRTDYNLNTGNKISFRYNQLDSSAGKNLSGSSSVGFGRGTFGTSFLNFDSSNYAQLENIKSGVGEWNSVLGTSISQSLIVGYTTNNEDRAPIQLFPFVDILAPDGTAYTSLGSEPFTPSNALQYQTFQIKDDFTKFSAKHSWTVGGTMQRYHQVNVFAPLLQSAYVYNSLQDFYTDANGFLANPNRTTSPVTLRRFQVRYNNIPGQTEPVQPMMVYYSGGYAQDEYRPRTNMTITGGLRFDVAKFTSKGFPNPNADALMFRDESGKSVQYSSGHLPDPKVLWSPRVAFNWDVAGQQKTQVRVGTGVFTGPPLYVWISNQVGNTGVLTGFDQLDNVTNRPFNPNVDTYKPANITGAPAASYELDITDNSFKFPQVWRTNLAVDRRLPGGITSTTEYIYNKDINGIYYVNANLPAPTGAFTGADTRPRYTTSRIYNAAPNVITATIVMKNQSVGRSWNISETLSKTLYHGLTLRGAYSYGESKNTIDPGSTAFSSWQLNQTPADPNNPGLGRSKSAQGHRVFVQSSYTRSYFGFGATTVSAFWEAKPSLNGVSYSSTASYVFAGDMNGDGAAGNDLIYIPRNTSEMNFVDIPATATTRGFTAAEQTAAFEAYIQQDKYLSEHRGQYAERGGIFYPIAKRMDLSIVQDVFHDIGGKRNAGQFRIDFTNFGNLLNHNWGVSQRLVVPTTQAEGAQLLTNPGVDAQGRATYRLAVANGQLVTKTFQPNTNLFSDTRGSDVYQFMLSFRYSFN
jgi:Carboxypeptidase regulatory-like domain